MYCKVLRTLEKILGTWINIYILSIITNSFRITGTNNWRFWFTVATNASTILNKFAIVLWTNIIFNIYSVPILHNISSIVRKVLQSMLVHYHLAILCQYLEFRQSTYIRYWVNVFKRLDHFSVVSIMLVKCKIQHFQPLVGKPTWRRQYQFNVISKRRTDIRPLGNWRRSNIRPMFLCYSGIWLYIFINLYSCEKI